MLPSFALSWQPLFVLSHSIPQNGQNREVQACVGGVPLRLWMGLLLRCVWACVLPGADVKP